MNRGFYYDLNFNTAKGTFGYINKKGVAVAEQDIATIAHELGHAMKGLDDNWEVFNNYSGENVTYVNKVLVELGIDEVLSYAGSAYSDIIDIGRDYAKGQAINRAYTYPDDRELIGNMNDLYVGTSGDNVLRTFGGNDILVGNNGNDLLYGGDGIDLAVYEGNQLDYDVRLNKDGYWVVKHVRGAKDEGEDTLYNMEKIRFDKDESFDLKRGSLTFQTDFALVIDTTGSMGKEIFATFNF